MPLCMFCGWSGLDPAENIGELLCPGWEHPVHLRIEEKWGEQRGYGSWSYIGLWHFGMKEGYPVTRQVVGNVIVFSTDV